MTPNELYAMPPQELNDDLNLLRGCHFNHIPEIDEWVNLYDIKYQDKIDIKILKEFHFDHRRFWRLGTVWFNKQPVMIIRNAGREGDDHYSRYVTDEAQYAAMISYIRSLLPADPQPDLVDPNADIPGLTTFYGHSLDGPFERHDF